MRGKQTSPEKVEEVVATAIRTDNKAETGRVLGIPRETVRDIVSRMTEPEVAELRRLANNEYVIKTWQNILDIEEILVKKLKTIDDEELKKVAVQDITKALNDLKRTIDNVVNNIHIGDNIQNNISPELIEQEAIEYLVKIGYKVEK